MSKRAIEREQGTIETGGKKGRQVLRRQNVREFVTLCVNLLLLCSGKQSDPGDSRAGKINKPKKMGKRRVNELVSFVRSKSTTPRIDKSEKKKRGTETTCGTRADK
jgi:hypothetical protein